MQPTIAICRHAVDSDEQAVFVAQEAAGPVGVEVSARPEDLEFAVRSGQMIRHLSDDQVAVRYHFPLGHYEITHADATRADEATRVMMHFVSLIAEAGGDSLTVHAPLHSEERGSRRLALTKSRLRELTAYGTSLGVSVCLENLRWGLTAEPDAFIDLAEYAGCRVTFDVGHGISSAPGSNGYPAPDFVRSLEGLIDTAHVYGHETDHHHPPKSLSEIESVLDALCDVGCAWWTIELFDLAEIRTTREMMLAHRC